MAFYGELCVEKTSLFYQLIELSIKDFENGFSYDSIYLLGFLTFFNFILQYCFFCFKS